MTDDRRRVWNARHARAGNAVPDAALVLREGARWLPEPRPEPQPELQSEPQYVPVKSGDLAQARHVPAAADGQLQDPHWSIPGRATALDLACGQAGNGQWLARRGFEVTAWDISDAAIERLQTRQPALIEHAAVRDVSAEPPAADSFDVIVVARFLDRALCPAIAQALKPGGTLFYQTFTHGLSNPDYLLRANELLFLFDSLRVLEYHEPEVGVDGKAEARLVARRD